MGSRPLAPSPAFPDSAGTRNRCPIDDGSRHVHNVLSDARKLSLAPRPPSQRPSSESDFGTYGSEGRALESFERRGRHQDMADAYSFVPIVSSELPRNTVAVGTPRRVSRCFRGSLDEPLKMAADATSTDFNAGSQQLISARSPYSPRSTTTMLRCKISLPRRNKTSGTSTVSSLGRQAVAGCQAADWLPEQASGPRALCRASPLLQICHVPSQSEAAREGLRVLSALRRASWVSSSDPSNLEVNSVYGDRCL